MFDYDRALWKDWCEQVWPGIKSKVRTPIEGLLAAGFALAAYRWQGMDLAGDYAFKTAASILSGLAAFAAIHLVSAWALAPRRIFNRQNGELSELRAKLVTFEQPAMRRARKADIIPLFHEISRRQFIISMKDIEFWHAEAVACAKRCLKELYAEELPLLTQSTFNTRFSHEHEKVLKIAEITRGWLNKWEDKLEDYHINPDFVVPADRNPPLE
jgi:hypothetical protein